MTDFDGFMEDMAEQVKEFSDLYGFEHDCHCKEDFEEGKVGLVSECYIGLTDDALTQCSKFKGKLAELERTLTNLRIQVTELGGEPRA